MFYDRTSDKNTTANRRTYSNRSSSSTANRNNTFTSEANKIALLSAHPHIINIIDVGYTNEGLVYLSMDLCQGTLATQTKLSWNDFLQMVAQISSAIDYAHSQNIIHCDIKPSNILVKHFATNNFADNSQNSYILADFGVSIDKIRDNLKIIGYTKSYVAPETYYEGLCLPQSDVYSFAKTLQSTLPQVSVPLDKLKDVNRTLKQALCPDYTKRTATADELYQLLKEL